jgi:O-antigen ligase
LTDFLVIAVVVALFLVYRVSWLEFFWKGPSKYLSLLLVACFVSIVCSITSTYALGYWRFLQLMVPVLLFQAIRCLGEKIDLTPFVYRVAWILVILCGMECVISLCQYFMQHSLGLKSLGEKNLHLFPFPNPGKHRWLLDQFFQRSGESAHLFRASGTFPHPNILGGFVFSSTMASLFLFVQEVQKSKKIFLQMCILLQLFTLFIAFSRSAMIALGLSVFLWCILQFWYARKDKMVLRRARIVMGALLVGGLLCMGLFYSQMMARGEISGQADSERMQYIRVAFEMVKEHPFFGVGYNNFQIYTTQFQGDAAGHHLFARVHNIYLLFAAETGLVGGGLFFLFLFAVFRFGMKGDAQTKIFLLSVFAGFLFIGVCDFYFVGTTQGSLLFFGIAGLLCHGQNRRSELYCQTVKQGTS